MCIICYHVPRHNVQKNCSMDSCWGHLSWLPVVGTGGILARFRPDMVVGYLGTVPKQPPNPLLDGQKPHIKIIKMWSKSQKVHKSKHM